MEELKPCPFCGGEAHPYAFGVVVEYHIGCAECGASTRDDYNTLEDAVKAWNRRHDDDQLQKTGKNVGAQPSEIVFCQDCKYYDEVSRRCHNNPFEDSFRAFPAKNDGYCAWGIRAVACASDTVG